MSNSESKLILNHILTPWFFKEESLNNSKFDCKINNVWPKIILALIEEKSGSPAGANVALMNATKYLKRWKIRVKHIYKKK
jgi:hypothetical protein